MLTRRFEKTDFQQFAMGREIARIENGPDKASLVYALATKGEMAGFELRSFGLIHVGITAMEAEDGDKENWIIRGHADGEVYRLHYRTDERKGVWYLKKK